MNYSTINLKQLEERHDMLEKALTKANHGIENAPAGSLHVVKKANHFEYYQRLPQEENVSLEVESVQEKVSSEVDTTRSKVVSNTYISSKNTLLLHQLAQKQYDKKFLITAKKEYDALHRFLKTMNSQKYRPEEAYEQLSEGAKLFVKPYIDSEKEFVKKWMEEKYDPNAFSEEDESRYYTDLGERVRSKSEILIANELYKQGIPYHYEKPLRLKNGKTYYPDFTLLRARDRKQLYWEHLGLLDDYLYREKNLGKIGIYEDNGIFPGRDLILTHETNKEPLSTIRIRQMIRTYLK